VSFIDYKKKEIGIKKVIYNPTDIGIVRNEIAELYTDVTAKYPEKFSLEVNRKKEHETKSSISTW